MASEIEVLEDNTTAAAPAPANGAGPAAAADESLKDDVYTAAAYGDLEKLQRLVEAEAASVADSDGNGYHALQWAALNNRVAAAQYSLEAHNDSNTATPSIEPKGTVLWPASWPSCMHTSATGDTARPRPWPSFDCYHHGRILLQSRLQPQGINLQLSKCEPPVSSFCCAASCDLPVNCYCAENFDQPNAALLCCYGKYLCFHIVYAVKMSEYLSWLLDIMARNQLDFLCSPVVAIPFNSLKAMYPHYDSCHYGESLPLNSVGHMSSPLIVASCVVETQMGSDVGPSVLLRSEFVTGQHHSVSVLLCSHNGVAHKYQNSFFPFVKNVVQHLDHVTTHSETRIEREHCILET